jgi:hypothetical protein
LYRHDVVVWWRLLSLLKLKPLTGPQRSTFIELSAGEPKRLELATDA